MKTSTMWAILAVFAFIAVVSSFMNNSEPEEYIPDKYDAFTMAKRFVTKNLKAPSTAEFASMHESMIRESYGDSWRVSSYVDSQNGFGAMIRTEFNISMIVDRKTREWVVTQLETNP